MNKKTMTVVAITVIVTLILAPKIKSLPLLNKLPTI